jgi:hypothetical protein
MTACGVRVLKGETASYLRHGSLLSLMLCVAAAIGACGSGPSNSLPEELLGQWYFLGSSGGIDGDRGNDEATGYIVLYEGRMDVHDDGGTLTRQETFSPSRGKTIYSGEDLWILNFEQGEAHVVLVSPDGQTMSLSPNVYDSIGQDYSRTR